MWSDGDARVWQQHSDLWRDESLHGTLVLTETTHDMHISVLLCLSA